MPISQKPLRVALIGTGYMGKSHALAWSNVGRVFNDVAHPVLDLLVEVNSDLAKQRAADLGFRRSSGDWQSAVADPEVDVVSIASPTWLHKDMALAALAAGKHIWCEKPMSLSLKDAYDMRDAARASGRSALLGYNYIQSPMIRLARDLVAEGKLGNITSVRCEMDEDFMADPNTEFSWVSEPHAGSALQEFAVHPLSLLSVLIGLPVRVLADESKPYAQRKTAQGQMRDVGNCDLGTILFRMENGAAGSIAVNRSGWGRKGRLVIQLFGDKGTIYFDEERFNELQIFSIDQPAAERGFRTILTGPQHYPYSKFLPVPGHGLGFNELKVIECREVIEHIARSKANIIDFDRGARIEETVYAAIESAKEPQWRTVEDNL
jgi:predicted dehydrogenase